MPSGKKNQFTGPRLQALLTDLRAGMTYLPLAKKYSTSTRTLRKIRREHGFPVRAFRHELTAEECEEFAAAARAGMTLGKLCIKHHICQYRAAPLRAKLCPEMIFTPGRGPRRAEQVGNDDSKGLRNLRVHSRDANQDALLALLSAGNNNYEFPYSEFRARAMACTRMSGPAFARAFAALLDARLVAHDVETGLVAPTAPRTALTKKHYTAHHKNLQADRGPLYARAAHRVSFERRDFHYHAPLSFG